MALPVVQFNVHKKGKRGVTVFYNCKLHNFVSGSSSIQFKKLSPDKTSTCKASDIGMIQASDKKVRQNEINIARKFA